LVTPLLAKHIECGTCLVVVLRRFMMWNLMKLKAHKKKKKTMMM
jgi:hypothetical protein